LRTNLLVYLSQIGFTTKTAECVIQILNTIDIFDDISLYQLCHLVTQWEIPTSETSKEFLKEFEQQIISFSTKQKIPSHFYCILWFKAKYSHPEDLLSFISTYEKFWQTNSFLRRQFTAILARFLISNREKVKEYLYNQISSGITNTVTLANQIFQFSIIKSLDNKLNYYLFPRKRQSPYPLSKFLVLCSVLNSPTIRVDELVKQKIKYQITDPFYLKWLDAQYNIN